MTKSNCYSGNFLHSTGILMYAAIAIGCNQSNNTSQPPPALTSKNLYVVYDSVKVHWTAFKTTSKIAVKGTFTNIELKGIKDGQSLKQVLNGSFFTISVSNIFSNNEIRDLRLKTIFFGAMKNPEVISGTLHYKNDIPYLYLKINGIAKEVPLETSFKNNRLKLKASIQLLDFNAVKALAALNAVCFEQHKGADGISKIWDEVEVVGTVLFSDKRQIHN
ncbi:YceI family protein [Pedobacter sp. KBW06]|uniref:YceI family protein n=1 Tax=Pedobacter sp. KBW06 TaxID=2153359 RepID=UPI00131560C6|nr:YceI family protein [Pedobacter sp. KBW06]